MHPRLPATILLALGLAAAATGVAREASRRPLSDGRIPAAPIGYRLDLNAAQPAELMLLPGIGPTLAQRIDQRRADHGDFADADDLAAVRGIGPRTLARVRPLVSAAAADD